MLGTPQARLDCSSVKKQAATNTGAIIFHKEKTSTARGVVNGARCFQLRLAGIIILKRAVAGSFEFSGLTLEG